ncbi:MAG: IgGFc-binding protein [Nannocystis sp.]|nr:IgGFc-binding protein [Nannocystis sp.]
MQLRRLAPLLALPLFACGDDGGADTTATTGGSGSTTASSSGATTSGATTTTGTSSGATTGMSAGETTSSGASDTVDPSTSSAGTTSAGTTTDGATTASTTSTTTGEPPCAEGTMLCEEGVAKVCDGLGGFSSEEVCADECVAELGCVLCAPGSTKCEGSMVLTCDAMGEGFVPSEECDAVQGLACDPDAGACVGACAALGLSYIGCDYYPTVLQQFDGYNSAPSFVWAVAVANTSDEMVQVTVTKGPDPVTVVQVAPASVQLVTLPWVPALSSGYGGSVVVPDGAYRLRSTRPVTVYQYNPLTVTHTNDASLLLPTNTWTGNYVVAAWPTWPFGGNAVPGLYSVVARFDGTTVTLKPSGTGGIVKPGGGVAADGKGVISLNEGDVLQVLSNYNGDVTGTIIAADKPVQVFGGHKCTNVPLNVTACDHLEESMFPIETLAKEYVVVPPVQVPNDKLDKGQVVRVIASEDATTLTFEPDQPGNKLLAKAGDFLELPSTTQKFVVSADKKILVAQYMVGQDGGFGASDPAMLLAVNPQQWRTAYLFHAATLWQANYVDILAPKGAVVTVDGAAVGSWQAVGASNYQVAHVKLPNINQGNHAVSSDVPVGISVYGVQSYGSYWYPGGLDLDLIPQ